MAAIDYGLNHDLYFGTRLNFKQVLGERPGPTTTKDETRDLVDGARTLKLIQSFKSPR